MPTEQYKMPLQNTSGAIDRLSTGADFTDPMAFDTEAGAVGWDSGYWLERIEAFIERYPWPTVLVALGVGYMVARRMR